MATRIVLQQILQHEQRRSRSGARGQRIGATGIPLSGEAGEEDFLQHLKNAIEARVPSLHGAPAGTGGTGATGEEESDQESKAPDGEDRGAIEASSASSEDAPSQWRCHIISPRETWKVCWDVFIGVLIIYTIITLTWRIGFNQEAVGAALVFEYSVDVLFAVDTILCFRTGFYREDVLVTDWWEIARRYCLSYFLFDLMSWFPIDLLVQVLTGQSGASIRSVKLMKFVRLVRLAKLMRLFKLNRFLVILEEKLHLKPAMIRMVRLIINIVFLAHLLACMWHFIALPACGEAVPAVGPCPDTDEEQLPNWIRELNVDNFDLISKYIASFHFITATMMAVGYGDIWAKNTEERLFCVVLQLFGATAFGFILSSVTALLESANPRANETNKRINEIKEWCAGRQMPRHLRTTIREHTQYVLRKKSIFNEADILANIPTSIRMDIIQNSYGEWLRVVERPFRDEDLALRMELVLLMAPQQVHQNEVMIEEGEITCEVYVVLHGCLEAVCCDNPETSPSNWVGQSLNRSEIGEEESGSDSSDSNNEVHEVLCGLYRSGDMLGHVVAAPIRVRGLSSFTDVLSINKDALADLQLRAPGGMTRAEADEERAKAEIAKVLASELRSTCFAERPAKSLVLLRGVATSSDELPQVVLTPERNTPIPLALLRVSAGSSESRGEVRAEMGMTRKARPSIELPSPPTTPSRARLSTRSIGSYVSSGTKSSKSSTYPLLLSTRRLNVITHEIEMTEETEECLLQRYIIPPNWRWKLRWDILVGALIIYSVLIIPWRICFDIQPDVLATVVDVMVDVIFGIDLVCCFRTAFVDSDGTIDTVAWHISRRYLRTWFTFDLLSTFPVDRVIEVLTGEGGEEARALKMIRMVRLIRLLKLARMLKMGKLVQRIEDMLDLSPLTLKCINLGTKLTVMSHFLGCFWFFVSTHGNLSANECESGLLECDATQPGTTWWQEISIQPEEKFDQYIAALYWAFTTMTTVGYGDIHPRSNRERVYAIVAMIFGATMFGYIIGSIAALAGQERGIEALTKKRLSMVRAFCDDQRVSENKVREVMKHYQFFYAVRSPFNETALMMELPNWVRKKVSRHIHREAIAKLGIFAGPQQKGLDSPLPEWFICWALRILEPQAVCAGEIVINAEESSLVQELFLVFEGECEAFYHRSLWRRPAGGHSDTGGSADHLDDQAPTQSTTSGAKPKTLMVFSPGCVFGLEHLANGSQRYSVRCSKSGPCLLYVLRQATMAEVQANNPEMVKVLQKAIANLLIAQTKQRVPQKNLEIRKRPHASEGMARAPEGS